MGRTRGERLREARGKFFDSAREAARALGMPFSTYGAHERAESPGGRDFGPEEAKRYARRFKVDPEWLLTNRWGKGRPHPASSEPDLPAADFIGDDRPKHKMTQIVGYVGAGGVAHYYAVAQGSLDEVPAPRKCN